MVSPELGPAHHQLERKRIDGRSIALAGLLLCSVAGIAMFSPNLEKSRAPSFAVIAAFIALYMFSGGVFLLLFARFCRAGAWGTGWLFIGLGVALRGTMLFSTPILEDDFYRYLLDGGLVARGINPYTWAPSDIIARNARAPDKALAVGRPASAVLEHINHPAIRTIYPPVAQGVFALSYFVSPFGILGLRSVFLLFDGAALLLLLRLLARLGRDRRLAAFYWWNPMVVKELINACHMDAILLPFLLGALLCLLSRRWVASVVAIMLATGVKLWPVIFLPFVVVHLIRSVPSGRRRIAALLPSVGVVGVLGALLAWPIWASGPDETSGFFRYTFHWRNNDALYRLLMMAMKPLMQRIGITGMYTYKTARFVIGGIYLLAVGGILFRLRPDARNTVKAWLLVVALLYLLSPTQFPWYFTWVIPFLAVHPWPALALYMVTLPLYYFQHALPKDGGRWWFDHVIVWIEHVPVLMAILVTSLRKRVSPLRALTKQGGPT